MSRRTRTTLILLLLVAVMYAVTYLTERDSSEGSAPDGDVYTLLDEAFRTGRSDFVVEIEGVVQRILPDDREGSQHQRFVLELPTAQTLLVSHNIDLAQRVPITAGDRVGLRGEYEWNDRGGVIHWTHHDPRGRREGGWIQFDGAIYE